MKKTTRTEGSCRIRNSKRISKRGALELSIGAIVILVLAITLLILGVAFIMGTFGKTRVRFEELISKEAEPPVPSSSYPITLSRETITTNAGETEALKISIYNPTNEEWTFRDYIKGEPDLCGLDGDRICYVNTRSTLDNICNNDINALANDDDCRELDEVYHDGDGHLTKEEECNPKKGSDEEGHLTEPPEGICYIDNVNCPQGEDPDCAPAIGVRLSIKCSQELDLETKTNPKTIPAGEFTTFTALLEIKKGIPEKIYLCQISIIGGAEGITKDLQVQVL